MKKIMMGLLLFCISSCASNHMSEMEKRRTVLLAATAPQTLSTVTRLEASFADDINAITKVIVESTMKQYGWKMMTIGRFQAETISEIALEKSITDEIVKDIGQRKDVSIVELKMSSEALNELKITLQDVAYPSAHSDRSVLLKDYRSYTFVDVILSGTFIVHDDNVFITAYFTDTKTGIVYKQDFNENAKDIKLPIRQYKEGLLRKVLMNFPGLHSFTSSFFRSLDSIFRNHGAKSNLHDTIFPDER